jgi:hypothetical protein
MGRDSSVGIATGYGLDGPGIESRWGARFFAHVQTGPGAHPASWGQSGRGVVLTTHPLLAPRSRKSRAIPLSALWAFGPVTGYLYLNACVFITPLLHVTCPTHLTLLICDHNYAAEDQ